jgi:hypothetical protein
MSSQHVTFENAVKTAEVTKANTIATNELTRQTTINASGDAVGYHPGTGSAAAAATYQAAVASANAALAQNRYLAEMTKQAAIAVAKDILRNAATGEVQ